MVRNICVYSGVCFLFFFLEGSGVVYWLTVETQSLKNTPSFILFDSILLVVCSSLLAASGAYNVSYSF